MKKTAIEEVYREFVNLVPVGIKERFVAITRKIKGVSLK